MEDNQILFAQIRQTMNRAGEFTCQIGVEITHVGFREAEGILRPDSTHRNPVGSIHGGCICTLMDAVGGAAGTSAGFGCVTVDCAFYFLKASAPDEPLHCRATVVKAGHHIQVVDAWVTNSAGVAVAKGTYTYCMTIPIETRDSNE